MGNKLLGGLSELVMIKSNIKPQPVQCIVVCVIDSVSLSTVGYYVYYWCLEINVINYMFLHFNLVNRSFWNMSPDLVFVLKESDLTW